MKVIHCRQAPMVALSMLMLVVGCATQGEPKSVAAAPVVVSAEPLVVSSAPPPAAVAPHAAKPAQALPPPNELEVRYGIQIAQLGLTASGGLVDVRFKVLDAAKARSLLTNPANAPMLMAGDKPPLMPPHHALRGAKFVQGQVFYILYPNLRGAVQPGAEVTVAMGEARLGPVKVQ